MTVQATLMEASIKTQGEKAKTSVMLSVDTPPCRGFEHKYVGSFLFHEKFSTRCFLEGAFVILCLRLQNVFGQVIFLSPLKNKNLN